MSKWWEEQLFDYVYHDGNPSQDDSWLNELNFIGDEFKKFGMGWCMNGQHWKPNNQPCWSDDF